MPATKPSTTITSRSNVQRRVGDHRLSIRGNLSVATRDPVKAIAHRTPGPINALRLLVGVSASTLLLAAGAQAAEVMPPKAEMAAQKMGSAATDASKATSKDERHEVHWSYEGAGSPANWGKLKPEFNVCAIGKRQSPINIYDSSTLNGPAEPIQFNYATSNASVVNTGHSVQVDVEGNNFIVARGTRYKLVQFHFHTPSEEVINKKRHAMVAHLVHRSDEGQLAVVAVLLDPGENNHLLEKVWTYLPLDVNDRVRMPQDAVNLNELLPTDQRYYQYIGSLTTPPCTEGVLWTVLKTPMSIGRNQYRLFTQMYPMNARPVQQANGRLVREAQ